MYKKVILSLFFSLFFLILSVSGASAQNTACQVDTDCTATQYCYQPPMSDCPEGMGCAAVMPDKYCAEREGRIPATPAPEGCYYQQVQCIQAPCDPVLVCPSTTPLPSASPVLDPCRDDNDCSDGYTCYQPPMPECPADVYCIQVMPGKYCKLQDTIILNQDLPNELSYVDISTTSRYPTVFQLNDSNPKAQDPTGGSGYAMGFKFQGVQGQNLQSLVSELSDIGSYIHTHLYGPNKKRITKADTRIDFTISEAGTYYLIAQTFGEKQGDIGVQVFNRDEQKLKGSFVGQNLDAVFPPRLLPTYGTSVINVGRLPFSLQLEFPDTVYLKESNTVEYFSKEAGKTIKVRPTLYRDNSAAIINRVNSRENMAPLAISFTKLNDKTLSIKPMYDELFKPGYYYGFISDMVFDQVGVSGMNFYTFFAAISESGRLADLNGDGKVNLADFTILSREFMSTNSLLQADINGDGRVNLSDYTLLVAEFGNN